MEELSFESVRKLQLGALKGFVGACEQHGLRYFLYGGTLLGAVRHAGFIPWDDDVDVAMPRPDYLRLIELQRGGRIGVDNLRLLCAEVDEDYPFPMAKWVDDRTVLIEEGRVGYWSGVGIDVFPIDSVPDLKLLSRVYFVWIRWLLMILYVKGSDRRTGRSRGREVVLRVGRLVLSGLNYRSVVKCIHRSVWCRYGSTQFVAILSSQYGLKGRVPLGFFEEFELVEFEGTFFRAPAQWDAWLRAIYGDYMKLPARSHQISHHSYVAYLR